MNSETFLPFVSAVFSSSQRARRGPVASASNMLWSSDDPR